MEKLSWLHRYANFSRAYLLLEEGLTESEKRPFSRLEKEGLVYRFKYTLELAWKTMKDFLQAQDVAFDLLTPRTVIREAFTANLIQDGDAWMKALDSRNEMSHA